MHGATLRAVLTSRMVVRRQTLFAPLIARGVYRQAMSGTGVGQCYTRRAVLAQRMVLRDARQAGSTTLWPYAIAMRCPVLTKAIVPRVCYAMSGNELGSAATHTLCNIRYPVT
eukprot:3941512-Rhodomonas_salina.4